MNRSVFVNANLSKYTFEIFEISLFFNLVEQIPIIYLYWK